MNRKQTMKIQAVGDGRRIITATALFPERPIVETVMHAWSLDGGEPDLLARFERVNVSKQTFAGLDPESTMLARPGRKLCQI